MAGKPTIRDIAQACGYSTYTVSAVLNNKGKLRDATRQAVLEAARRLNYDPLNTMPLARRATARALAMVIPGTTAENNPFYVQAASAARRVAAQRDHDFKLFTLDDLIARFSRRDDRLVGPGFDHLIVFACDPPKRVIRTILDRGIGVALVRRTMDLRGLVIANDDDRRGMHLAVEHLHAVHGHRKIGLVAAHYGNGVANLRRDAFREALNQYDLPTDPQLEIARDQIDDCLVDWVRQGKLTGLACMSDDLAVIAAKAVLRAGFDVPGDLSIVGYNDSLIAEVFHPGLTSVRIPVEQMVAAACTALLTRDPDAAPTATTLSFDNTLITRDSCAPPARARARARRSARG